MSSEKCEPYGSAMGCLSGVIHAEMTAIYWERMSYCFHSQLRAHVICLYFKLNKINLIIFCLVLNVLIFSWKCEVRFTLLNWLSVTPEANCKNLYQSVHSTQRPCGHSTWWHDRTTKVKLSFLRCQPKVAAHRCSRNMDTLIQGSQYTNGG